jgi:hypothetical protein
MTTAEPPMLVQLSSVEKQPFGEEAPTVWGRGETSAPDWVVIAIDRKVLLEQYAPELMLQTLLTTNSPPAATEKFSTAPVMSVQQLTPLILRLYGTHGDGWLNIGGAGGDGGPGLGCGEGGGRGDGGGGGGRGTEGLGGGGGGQLTLWGWQKGIGCTPLSAPCDSAVPLQVATTYITVGLPQKPGYICVGKSHELLP